MATDVNSEDNLATSEQIAVLCFWQDSKMSFHLSDKHGFSFLADNGYGCQKYMVRLLTYLPGVTISKVPLTAKLLFETGKMAARMDVILKKV